VGEQEDFETVENINNPHGKGAGHVREDSLQGGQ
jgi:hypothetical protein